MHALVVGTAADHQRPQGPTGMSVDMPRPMRFPLLRRTASVRQPAGLSPGSESALVSGTFHDGRRRERMPPASRASATTVPQIARLLGESLSRFLQEGLRRGTRDVRRPPFCLLDPSRSYRRSGPAPLLVR